MFCSLKLLKTFTFFTGIYRMYTEMYTDSNHQLQAVKMSYGVNNLQHNFILTSHEDHYLSCFPNENNYALFDPKAFPTSSFLKTGDTFHTPTLPKCIVNVHYNHPKPTRPIIPVYKNLEDEDEDEDEDFISTGHPTQQPSSQPTNKPVTTQQPSSKPTTHPVTTQQPSSQPTTKPVTTQQPSSQPTNKPVTTQQPSSQPTTKPVTTQQPSSQPTTKPVTPSSQPTTKPVTTQQPSSKPTTKPTSHPIHTTNTTVGINHNNTNTTLNVNNNTILTILDDLVEYLGCIKSPKHVHYNIWPGVVTSSYDDTNITLIEACSNSCQDLSEDNRYIGIDSGNDCLCGSRLPTIENRRLECMACRDTDVYTCGNVNYGLVSVYKLKNVRKRPTKKPYMMWKFF
jgi:hypothetical protein